MVLFTKLLFATAVMPPFFKRNPVFALTGTQKIDAEALDLPDKAISALWNVDKPPGQPYWVGEEYSLNGGRLGQLDADRNPINFAQLDHDAILIPNLTVEDHAAEILKYPMTTGAVDFDLIERLMFCFLLGRDVDPEKERTFPNHPGLQDDLFKQSRLYHKHQMPLLNAYYDLDSHQWIERKNS